MSNKEQEILNELILESQEHLGEIEPDLLSIEKNPSSASKEMINKIFRSIHSIKGGFGFFGIKHITHLAHDMEHVLARIRGEDIAFNEEIIDALLFGVDKLRVLLENIDETETISIDEELKKLSPFLKFKSENAGKEGEGIQVFELSELISKYKDISQKEISSVRKNEFLYWVELPSLKDNLISFKAIQDQVIDWKKIGRIAYSDKDLEKQKKINSLVFVFISVLDPTLISFGLNVKEENIKIEASTLEKFELQKSKLKEPQPTKEDNKSADKTETSKGNKKPEESLRVRLAVLDTLMNLAGELVLSRNQLMQAASVNFLDFPDSEKMINHLIKDIHFSLQNVSRHNTQHAANINQLIENELIRMDQKIKEALSFKIEEMFSLKSLVQNIDLVTSSLQEKIMQTRMQPVSVVFNKFPRVVRELEKMTGKQIELKIIGEEVELDKSIIELLSDPLNHLIRNCSDHGIESSEIRKKQGKPEKGQILLKAFHEGSNVNIVIKDDGAGIDPEKIKTKAIENGILSLSKAKTMTDSELQMLIFSAGFSTAKKVSDISGRGVGMDVVRANIERLGGTIDLVSKPNKGSTFTLKLPLTLAIITSFIVESAKRSYAIPQTFIDEIVRIRMSNVTDRIAHIQGSDVLKLRGKLLPLIRLDRLLNKDFFYTDKKTGEKTIDRRKHLADRRGYWINGKLNESREEKTNPEEEKRNKAKPDRRKNLNNAIKIVVLKLDYHSFGLVVENIQESKEIVVKSLSKYLKKTECYSGATILGDGKVAMILDPNGIANMAQLNFNDLKKEETKEKMRQFNEQDTSLHNLILFNNAADERFAVPLREVARIEKRDAEEIEKIGSKEYLQFEGTSIQLIRLENYLPINPPKSEIKEMQILIPRLSERGFGIITNNVDDVLKTDATFENGNISGIGILGSAIINRHMTVLIDIKELIRTVEPAFSL